MRSPRRPAPGNALVRARPPRASGQPAPAQERATPGAGRGKAAPPRPRSLARGGPVRGYAPPARKEGDSGSGRSGLLRVHTVRGGSYAPPTHPPLRRPPALFQHEPKTGQSRSRPGRPARPTRTASTAAGQARVVKGVKNLRTKRTQSRLVQEPGNHRTGTNTAPQGSKVTGPYQPMSDRGQYQCLTPHVSDTGLGAVRCSTSVFSFSAHSGTARACRPGKNGGISIIDMSGHAVDDRDPVSVKEPVPSRTCRNSRKLLRAGLYYVH